MWAGSRANTIGRHWQAHVVGRFARGIIAGCIMLSGSNRNRRLCGIARAEQQLQTVGQFLWTCARLCLGLVLNSLLTGVGVGAGLVQLNRSRPGRHGGCGCVRTHCAQACGCSAVALPVCASAGIAGSPPALPSRAASPARVRGCSILQQALVRPHASADAVMLLQLIVVVVRK
jgi:hypothetical protein